MEQGNESLSGTRIKVLVIDDNKAHAEGLAELLQLAGFEASFVLTGGEGVDAARRLGVDAVLLDINLPDMNGFEVCRRLRRDPQTAYIAVVFHTATYGINTAGTVYRMDDVPIPLRPAFESPLPSDEAVLRGIERRVKELKAAEPS